MKTYTVKTYTVVFDEGWAVVTAANLNDAIDAARAKVCAEYGEHLSEDCPCEDDLAVSFVCEFACKPADR